MRVNNTASFVAAEVRAEMARQGLSQQALAEKLGWRQQRLSRRILAEGSNNPLIPFDIAELADVANALGIPVAQLLPQAVTA